MEFEISLHDLQFYSYHGVLPHENEYGNKFIVNLSLRIPFRKEIEKDNLEFTVSYEALYRIIEEEMLRPKKLLETVAYQIQKKILSTFPEILGGNIKIEKSQPPIKGIMGSASVSLIF